MKKAALPWLFSMALFLLPFWSKALTVADSLIVNVESIADASCFGDSDGAIFLDVQGTPPFSFSWSNGETLEDALSLAAGIYSVVVSDSAGTVVVLNDIQVGQPDELVIEVASVVQPSCNGLLGSIATTAIGGTGDYSFEWSTGSFESEIQGLAPGYYTLVVTDANGCVATLGYDLQPSFPDVALFTNGNLSCLQSVVQLSGASSSTDVSFDWAASNGGQFSSSTDSMVVFAEIAGTYEFTVTDTLTGCYSTASVEITIDTLSPTADAGQDTTLACSNESFSLLGTASNGISFSYLWIAENGGNISSGSGSASPTIDHPGAYTLVVTNVDNGCTATDVVNIDALNTPPLADVAGSSLTCIVIETTISATIDSTNQVYSWSGPNGFASSDLNPTVLEAGIYSFEISDTVTTCTSIFEVEVEDNSSAPGVVVEDGILTCANNQVTLDASTTSGDAIYLWTGPNAYVSFELSPTVSEEGSYTLIVTDTLTGCNNMVSATVSSDYAAPSADAGVAATLNCYLPNQQLDGSASSQGNQFAYTWTTLDGNISAGENSMTPTVDGAGTYTLTVTNNVNGCTASAETVVTADFNTPVVEAFGGEVSCFEPEIILLSFFDTTNVTYAWSGPAGFTSDVQNPVATLAGEYTLTVTDTLNGCSASAVAVVEKLGTDPVLTLTGGTLTCYEPTVQVTVEANIEGIVWSWAAENGFTSTEQNPFVTEAGYYTVLAIDTLFGCIALDSVFVESDQVQPDANAGDNITFNCFVTDAVLNGNGSTGSVFSYNWTTIDGNIVEGDTTLNPSADAAGTYTLTVTNAANGCVSESTMTIFQTPALELGATSEDADCHGTASGSAAVTISGGTGSYTSTVWSSGSQSIQATDLVAGEYSVIVTDTDGCTAEAFVTIQQPTVLVADAVGVGQSLAGIDDGTATVIVAGGTQPYTFEWDNGATTDHIEDLAPGAYTVSVVDANGCRSIATANVNAFPCVLSSSIFGTDATCNGATTGEASVVLENAIEPYAFSWSNGDSLATASNLIAGIYTVVISDSTNCQNVLTVSISQPSAIVVTELFHVDVECPDDAIGFVIVGANGGVQPYEFLWSTGSTSNVANGLGTGSHSLSLTDASNCEHVYVTEIYAIDSEGPILVLQDLVIALDENGAADITASSLDAGSTDNCGAFTMEIDLENFDCTMLGTQTVLVQATDLNGNQSTGTVAVTIVDDWAPVLTCPSDIVVSACDTIVSFDLPTVADNCSVDMAQLEQTTGLPTGSAFPLGLTVQSFSYTDAAGNSGTCTFEVVLVEEMEVAGSFAPASCNQVCDGSIQLTITNGLPPFQVNWSNGETGEALVGLCGGIYTAIITDAGGCETTVSFQIEEPTALEATTLATANNFCSSDLNGAVSVAANGGTAPYVYAWSNGATSEVVENLASGIYEVVTTDGNGCQVTSTVEIISLDDEAPVLVLQNASFSLDDNGSVVLAAASFDAGSTDNCAIESWIISPNTLGCNDLGEVEVNLTAIDGNGNSSSATAMVTIIDDQAPVLVCPGNIVIGFCNPNVMFTLPQVTDNCDVDMANLTQTEGLPSGSAFPSGVTQQSFSYTDLSGNEGSCSFTVTINEAATIAATSSEVVCAGDCNGEITLEIAGTATPFTVIWSNGQTGTTATGLCPGIYSATIADAFGCLQSFTTTLDSPVPLVLTIDEVANDAGNTGIGAIQISVNGGTAPYTYTWTKDGQTFSSTSQDLTGLTEGVYAVSVFDANGCEIASGDITVNNTTSTTEPVWANGLTMQPNPASDWTRIQLANQLSSDLEVRIFDINGKSVCSFLLKNGEQEKELNLEAVPAGVYSVQLRTENAIAVRRLVVGK